MNKKKKKKPNTPTKPITTEGIFYAAASFEFTSRMLETEASTSTRAGISTPTLFPALALAAFSSELYLKCLIFMETNQAPWGHSLTDLFAALKQDSKDRIILINFHPPGVPTPHKPINPAAKADLEDAFYSQLNACSRAFEEFRYFHEKISESPMLWFRQSVGRPTRRRILEMRPDLGVIYERVFKLNQPPLAPD